MSRDAGATYAEIDAAQVRGDPNKDKHTTLASNFAATDIGLYFLFKLEALNPVGLLQSASVTAILASPPAAPAVAPTTDPAKTSAS